MTQKTIIERCKVCYENKAPDRGCKCENCFDFVCYPCLMESPSGLWVCEECLELYCGKTAQDHYDDLGDIEYQSSIDE